MIKVLTAIQTDFLQKTGLRKRVNSPHFKAMRRTGIEHELEKVGSNFVNFIVE
jgi:hypothetical protein